MSDCTRDGLKERLNETVDRVDSAETEIALLQEELNVLRSRLNSAEGQLSSLPGNRF